MRYRLRTLLILLALLPPILAWGWSAYRHYTERQRVAALISGLPPGITIGLSGGVISVNANTSSRVIDWDQIETVQRQIIAHNYKYGAMFRFTTRHMLWLTVVVALALCWSIERLSVIRLSKQQATDATTINNFRPRLDDERNRNDERRQSVGESPNSTRTGEP